MRIGIFGGSFNPAHMGHYEIIEAILSLKKVDKLIVVPNYVNPLKSDQPVLPETLRWEILTKTLTSINYVSVSDFEINQKKPSYTIDTLVHFNRCFPNDTLFLILGEDAFSLFPNWKQPTRITELAKILVLPRPDQIANVAESLYQKYRAEKLDLTIRDISATSIRNASKEQVIVQNLLHKDVLALWETYQSNNP